jgi:hypothetical protein
LNTSAVYRLAVLVPEQSGDSRFLNWARQRFDAVVKHTDDEGKVGSVASVNEIPSKHAAEQTSEWQSMAILIYAAWRDCVSSGVYQLRWRERLLP